MAELATGAVSTLLGVISNEASRLGRVRGDVQFIQEEMESMSSFLANQAAARGEHDEQVRTWMNQVRILANDCNNCIDLYLYRGNADLHLPRGGIRRYLWWAPWLLRKLVAQHRAAGQLSELKERARDIGERRLRYGVEVKPVAGQSSPGAGLAAAAETRPLLLAAAQGDEEEEDEDEDEDVDRDHPLDLHDSAPGPRALSLRHMDMEDYFKGRLDNWIRSELAEGSKPFPSIAFVIPKEEDARTLARQALAVAKAQNTPQIRACSVPIDPSPSNPTEQALKWKVVLVDVPAVHFDFLPLRPKDILYYILRELELGQDQQQCPGPATRRAKWDMYFSKKAKISEIKQDIKKKMKVDGKIEAIKTKICDVKGEQLQQDLEKKNDNADKTLDLDKLLWWLIYSTTAAAEQNQVWKKAMYRLPSYDDNIEQTADKLKEEVEAGGSEEMRLESTEYKDILKEVFLKTATTNPATTGGSSTLVDYEIKEMIQGVKEMLQELKELDNSDKNREKGEAADIPKDVFEETAKEMMKKIQMKIEKKLKIKEIVRRIKTCLGGKSILIILKTHDKYVSKWEETRNTLSLLVAGAVIVATKTTQQDKENFRYPQLEFIEYSLVGLYLDIVLQRTSQQMPDCRQILCNILDECKQDEFCMKIFAHALYAKPKRSRGELHKLHSILQMQVNQKSLASNAWKMFKFSYRDLPKQYRSCLLYLAIFRKGYKIRRSTLIGRWVAEGLITTKDWRWSSSVVKAEQCFDTLIAQGLVYPANIGGTGRVKSCVVDDLVYGFITKIATKQRIVETRLSHHLARHFSIFSDIRLRSSDTIVNFLENVPKLSQVSKSKLKVLDLEFCKENLAGNQRNLNVMCSNILLLKYLSLRGTDVTSLPRGINNLRELEVLDIRQTKIPASATRNVLLLKLKRLLAGDIAAPEFSSVQIPEKIEKMEHVKVLSNVKPQNDQDFDDIRKLQLKKLGVVINKYSHLQPLLAAISDLHECLRCLSITLDISTPGDSILLQLKQTPKVLESLSIIVIRSTQEVKLLPLLAKDGNQLAKVTLSGSRLSQDDLKVLAKLPKLRCVRLRHMAYTDSKLIFNKDEFQKLNNFLVEGTNITEIIFDNGAASKLEKIVLSSTNIKSIGKVDCLQNLEELELNNNNNMLNNNNNMLLSLLDNAKHIAKVTLHGTKLKQGDLQILAKKPKMRCLALLSSSYSDSQLIFNKDEFPKLNLLIVDCSDITKISFTGGSPKLEKIVWSFTKMESLSGIDNLPTLKELELNGDIVPNEVEEAINRQKGRLVYKHNKPENPDQATGNAGEEVLVTRGPSLWKVKGCCSRN